MKVFWRGLAIGVIICLSWWGLAWSQVGGGLPTSTSVTLPAGGAGGDTQVAFNDGGAFGGDADLTWNKTTNVLTLVNASLSGTITLADDQWVGLGAAAGRFYWDDLATDKLEIVGDCDISGNLAVTGTSTSTLQGIYDAGIKILEGGASPTYYTILQGGDQGGDLTYTLPTGYPAASGMALVSTDAGVMSWGAAGVNDAQYVTLATHASLSEERVLTGTANQITITDGGAGAAVTLSTPQNIHTSATPQFARLGLGRAAHATNVLDVTNNSWISARNAADTGTISMFRVTTSDQIEVGAALVAGSYEFTADSGAVTFVDFPVSATPGAGTEESYYFRIDATNIARVYAESDGAGGIQKPHFRVLNAPLALEDSATGIANTDATPDVSDGSVFIVASDADGTAITDLDNPTVGAIYVLIGGGGASPMTIADSGNFALSAAWTAATDDVLILYCRADNDYVQVGREDN